MANRLKVKFSKCHHFAMPPQYAHSGDAGFDLWTVDSCELLPGERAALGTGLCFEVPHGYELQVRPRSGKSLKSPALVILGTVDSGYRGEVKIIVVNMGDEPCTIARGERLAQGVLAPVPRIEFVEVRESDLSKSDRGMSGFGSTGA